MTDDDGIPASKGTEYARSVLRGTLHLFNAESEKCAALVHAIEGLIDQRVADCLEFAVQPRDKGLREKVGGVK